jgi:peptidoglycan/LPS O-acetylase OafA/YrhL
MNPITHRVPELDGIRGTAILMVVIFHYVMPWVSAKPTTLLYNVRYASQLLWTGVDLFFVLSGFLIGGILLDSRDSPTYFSTFYTRRFFRIVPLYIIWIITSFGTIWLITAGDFGKWIQDGAFPIWPYVGFVQNFWMAAQNHFPNYLGVSWSLAVEEQFYLTLPLIIRFAPRNWLPWIVGLGIVIAPALRLLIFYHMPQHPVAIYILMPTRADSLLFGVLGAMLMRDEKEKLRLKNSGFLLAVTLVMLAIFAGCLMMIDGSLGGEPMATVGYTLMAAFYLCLILFCITQTHSWLAGIMRLSWLRWLGTISYGVYLFHQQVLPAFCSAISLPFDYLKTPWGWVAGPISFVITVAICSVSWVYFEKPMISFGQKSRAWGGSIAQVNAS